MYIFSVLLHLLIFNLLIIFEKDINTVAHITLWMLNGISFTMTLIKQYAGK